MQTNTAQPLNATTSVPIRNHTPRPVGGSKINPNPIDVVKRAPSPPAPPTYIPYPVPLYNAVPMGLLDDSDLVKVVSSAKTPLAVTNTIAKDLGPMGGGGGGIPAEETAIEQPKGNEITISVKQIVIGLALLAGIYLLIRKNSKK